MPIAGIGAVPPQGPLYSELTSVVRRAFVRKLFVQIYFASPTLFYLWGNAQRAAGGVNQITIPMQGQSMVHGQFTGYGGGFNAPVVTPGIQNGQFALAYWVVPVPLPFGETVLQSTEAVIPLVKARMNDVYATTRQNVARLLFTNNTANALYPDSFINGFDNGTLAPTYGGINRTAAGNSAFKGQYIFAGNPSTWNTNYTTSTLGWSRKAMSALLINITNNAGGEAPTFGVMNPADFATLNNDIVGVESQYVQPGGRYTMDTPVRSSFPNVNVAGVPIFADYFCTVGNAFFVNVKYSNFYISEDAAMDFSGFMSLVPIGQIGQQGIVVLGYDFVTAKSSANAYVYGFGGNSF